MLSGIFIFFLVFIIAFSGVFINLTKKAGHSGVVLLRDSRSLLLFRLLVPGALVISVLVYFSGRAHIFLPAFAVYGGLMLVFAGLALRWAAVLSLGSAFTVQIAILTNHSLKTDGVYKYIRHPSYTGLLLYYLGLGLAMQNWLCLLLLVAGPLIAVLNRIRLEENILRGHFGEAYSDYVSRTGKLIPFIY
ncbi:MAG: isoprenylcysteine carboxylmethyltransferase family protein [Saprospiraceae bacterium]|nr:isoprenylcysteine carboxylmethyltransferase family protein [Saprospiraceae bacterium]